MRRRHKAQYAAHERAHLAPSMPHVRRDRCLPGAHPKPSATHPAASEERTVRTVFCILSDFVAFEFEQKAAGAAQRRLSVASLGAFKPLHSVLCV